MGRILMIEFDDRDTAVFDEIMRALEKHPSFEQFRLRDESTLSLPELDIFLQRRKAYSGYKEIPLTAKEFDILCMLAANKGIVLTYDQIYHRLWKENFPISKDSLWRVWAELSNISIGLCSREGKITK